VFFLHLIVVEDLEIDRKKLAELIQEDCAHQGKRVEFSFYANGEDFLAQYRPKSCDALFLDILLGGLSGLDIAQKIRQEEPRLPIIFTTTEPDFALDSYLVHAMDYLVKPLRSEKVSWCLKELWDHLAIPASISLFETSAWGHASCVEVPLDNILYGQYSNHIMDIHTTLGTFCTRLSFQNFTAKLPPTGRFFVCGRGLVVNLSQVARVSDDALLLGNGEKLPFSRRRKQEIQKAYTQWAFSCARRGEKR